MTEPVTGMPTYAVQYTSAGKASRKELPPGAQLALLDVLEKLSENPDAYPGRTRVLSDDGRFRVYVHPKPALNITYQLDADRKVLYLCYFVAPLVQITKPVFISYSHRDASWLRKLRMFLRPLENRGLIDVWDDREIPTGSDWLREIRAKLESARVAVFLVTQDFLDSAFIQEKELPTLLEAAEVRGCVIFVITVSSTTVGLSPLARFQGANKPSEPLDMLSEPEQNKRFVQISERMMEVIGAD
jgi:hypothetical protein